MPCQSECPCFTYEQAVHAVEGLAVAVEPVPNECNKAEDLFPDGSIIYSSRYINWWPAPGVPGQALGAVVSNDLINCQFTDWENNPFPPPVVLHIGGWDRMLSCINIMDQAYADAADPGVQAFCNW